MYTASEYRLNIVLLSCDFYSNR